MRTAIVCACLAALIPVLDQLTKYLVRTFLTVGDSMPVLGEFFRITYVLNDGMAFGKMGGSWRWVFMILTPLALIAIAVYLIKNVKSIDKPTAIAFTMIFAGGLSNMIDRIFFIHLDPSSTGLFDGRVVDFLDFNITLFGVRVWNYVFNVADACVVIGVFLFLGFYVAGMIRDAKNRKKAGVQPLGKVTVIGADGVERPVSEGSGDRQEPSGAPQEAAAPPHEKQSDRSEDEK